MTAPARTLPVLDEYDFIDLDFWGYCCRLYARDTDLRYFAWYFQSHRPAQTQPQWSILLTSNGPSGTFMTELANPAEKQIWIKPIHQTWTLYEAFVANGRLPSPVPPLGLGDFASRFRMTHAAMAAHPSRKFAVLIAGGSGTGKTTVALKLATRGWILQTDDLVVESRKSGLVHPYLRPLSLREPSWPLLPELAPQAASRGTEVRSDSGIRGWHVHPADLPIVTADRPRRYQLSLTLDRSDTLEVHRLSPARWHVRFTPAEHLTEVIEAIERSVPCRP